jgi:hypothetical protein
MHKYMKIGKRDGKKEKKSDFLLTGPGGGGDFGPVERGRARVCGQAAQPAHQRGTTRGRRRGRGPMCQRGGGTTLGGMTGGRRFAAGRTGR